MKSENVLLVMALLFVAVIGALLFGYIWQAGLDLNSGRSVKHWIELCSRSRIDIYCKSARRLTKDIKEPFVLIHPNKRDDEIAQDVLRLKAETGMGLDEIVSSNIFVMSKLTTGIHTSLNGKKKEVNCSVKDRAGICIIEGVSINVLKSFGRKGVIYSSLHLSRNSKTYDFLLPSR